MNIHFKQFMMCYGNIMEILKLLTARDFRKCSMECHSRSKLTIYIYKAACPDDVCMSPTFLIEGG